MVCHSCGYEALEGAHDKLAKLIFARKLVDRSFSVGWPNSYKLGVQIKYGPTQADVITIGRHGQIRGC